MRRLTLKLVRNTTSDYTNDGIDKFGYSILYAETNQPVGTSIRDFCSYGVRALLGNRSVSEQIVYLDIQYTDYDSPLVKQPGSKLRRLLLKPDGVNVKLHLINKDPTDIVFTPTDDQQVKDWLGWPIPNEQWVDILITPKPV